MYATNCSHSLRFGGIAAHNSCVRTSGTATFWFADSHLTFVGRHASYRMSTCISVNAVPLRLNRNNITSHARNCLWNSSLYRTKQLALTRCASSEDAPDAQGDFLAAAFQQELAARKEEEASKQFDGAELLTLLQKRYGRSYDVSLVQRQYMGKVFIALNIMWKYREQASFTLTKEEYMGRLDGVAAALRTWGVVSYVKEQIASRKDRPRVGKAVSIMLDLDEKLWKEFFLE